MAIVWNKFREITDVVGLSDYMKGREFGHQDYCHYTTLNVIDSMLRNNALWLSCVDGFNDKIDTKQFDEESLKKYYSICFATGKTENLSLWYIYSGVEGRGGRIRLTKSGIRKLQELSTFSLWEFDNKNNKIVNCVKNLEKNDFQLKFKDIIYYADQGRDKVDLKYNTMTNYNIKREDFDAYKKENVGFYKGTIWYYEKETRLLLELNDDIYNHFVQKDKNYKVVMEWDESFRKYINIELAPETETLEVKNELSSIRGFINETSKVKLSKYSGQISMNLCNKCEKTKGKI